jgi:large repetitive protein
MPMLAFTTNNLALGAHTVVAEYAGGVDFTGTTNSLAQDQVINTPPVAGNDTIQRNPLLTVKVRLATFLANDSDADGDTLGITVSPTSASNATVTVSGGWVFYTPAAGFTNADAFTYTITDGRGGSATGTVIVAIQVDNAPSQNLTITDLGGGSFRINGSGIVGYTYRLQASDTIAPFTWQTLSSMTADSTGKFTYTDTSGSSGRFYRTVYP